MKHPFTHSVITYLRACLRSRSLTVPMLLVFCLSATACATEQKITPTVSMNKPSLPDLIKAEDVDALFAFAQKAIKYKAEGEALEFLVCIGKDDRPCIDRFVEQSSAESFGQPEGSALSPFLYAVQAVNAYAVEGMLKAGVDPNAAVLAPLKHSPNQTLNYYAAVRLALNAYVKYKWWPRNKEDIKGEERAELEALYGPDIKSWPRLGYDILREKVRDKKAFSVGFGRQEPLSSYRQIFDLLLQYGADLTVRNQFMFTREKQRRTKSHFSDFSDLTKAIWFGDAEVVQKLIAYGADVNGSDNIWKTAISRDNTEILDILLKAGMTSMTPEKRISIPHRKVANYFYDQSYPLFKGWRIVRSVTRNGDKELFDKILQDKRFYARDEAEVIISLGRLLKLSMTSEHEYSEYMVRAVLNKGFEICAEVKPFKDKYDRNALDFAVFRNKRKPKVRAIEIFKELQPDAPCWADVGMKEVSQ